MTELTIVAMVPMVLQSLADIAYILHLLRGEGPRTILGPPLLLRPPFPEHPIRAPAGEGWETVAGYVGGPGSAAPILAAVEAGHRHDLSRPEPVADLGDDRDHLL
jgi:hypothetical protein